MFPKNLAVNSYFISFGFKDTSYITKDTMEAG